jgi:excisionase family DNA binding protein
MEDVAYYTLSQASKLLQISERTIQRKIKAGLIPKANFSGKVLIPAWFFKQGLEQESLHTVNK